MSKHVGASVEKRPNSIRIVFRWEGEIRRETLKTDGAPMPPTPANLKYARRLADEIATRIKHGSFVCADYFSVTPNASTGLVPTLGEWLDTWLKSQRVATSTQAGYSSAVRFWKLAAGETPLPRLKHSQVLTALAVRLELSGKTVNNYMGVLHQALALAVRDKALKDNPADGVPRAVWQREPPDPFSLTEAEKIIAWMRDHEPEPIWNMVEWRFFSGVRTSEMAGLKWPQVDLQSPGKPPGHFRINEALVRGNLKTTTKTGVSRDIRMNSRSRAALLRQRAHSQTQGEHVWLDPRYGTPWVEERAFRRSYWTPALKLLGIRYRSPNHMRHTFATMMLMAKNTPAWCASQMGHSVEIFHATYAIWIKGDQDQREVDGLEHWLKASA